MADSEAHRTAAVGQTAASLLFEVDSLRLPEEGRRGCVAWGRRVLAALGHGLRHLANFANEVLATGSSGKADLCRIELGRLRLLDLADEIEQGIEPDSSVPLALEKELVDVGL